MANIAFVPARAGSKSIQNKNIKYLNSKPLIFWVLEALQACSSIDEIVLATDSEEIVTIAIGFKFDKLQIFHRNSENATDHASTESVMLEFIQEQKPNSDDIFVLAQATSPFTTSNDFQEALAKYHSTGADSLLSVVRQKRFYWNTNGEPVNYDYKNRPRRQDFDGTLMENGAFYISTVGDIVESQNRLNGKIAVYEMDDYTGLELDEEEDWLYAKVLMSKFKKDQQSFDIDKIKLVLSDVDGVLTDAGMYYSENGDELKKFNTYDGMAFKLLKNKGIKVGIITSEDRELNRRRVQKLILDYQFHGVTDKLSVLNELVAEMGISLSEVAYVGDDINDLEVLQHVGIAACPSNANKKIKAIPGIIQLETSGGNGVLREFVDKYFES